MIKYFGEIVGWYGAVAILIAYALVSFSLLTPTSLEYQILNLTGGIGIVIDSIKHKDYPPTVLNVVWSIIAVVAILRVLFTI